VKTAVAAHSNISILFSTDRIIITENLITFAVFHENSIRFDKMKA
jgi:hypothetical protein